MDGRVSSIGRAVNAISEGCGLDFSTDPSIFFQVHVWDAGFVAIGIVMAANPMAHVAASAGLFTFCIGYLRCFLVIFFEDVTHHIAVCSVTQSSTCILSLEAIIAD